MEVLYDREFIERSDENTFFSNESEKDEDLQPKQKRAFVKMLAKFIRCAILLIH